MIQRLAAALAALSLLLTALPASADDRAERVRGYFCDSKDDHIAFLTKQAEGETEIMAANAVNKTAGKQSCAPYLPVSAIPSGEKTVVADGLVFKVQSFVFLPEKVERWTGSVFGSLQKTAQKHDI